MPNPTVFNADQKPLNPFRIREDTDAGIIPEKEHRKEQELKMKVPGILKSNNSENIDLELVFQSARDTNEKKKVEFDIESS